MARSQRSPTQIIMDRMIFKPTTRTPRKKQPAPTEVKTLNYTAALADSMWLRRRARRKPC